ncbi:hypothetical protein EN833_21120 [Mesorhizobium sp. M4B.F.Ca.ET.190.01.1.1]|uniref:hypothetical protein n=1 Tax=unclassified Mesorhizobium TaxID=325217 RepID=UPI000493C4D6|nr:MULTISPECIES: hypothetical protein [Mesorhizobium]RUW86384.1 hypothetical protein EOA29_00095 [Mesorhizobium sp. M1E.F.Ca.ET.063.01.1.1]RWF44898.1 MAG: hypothetical protein EOS65_00855 [Mesorhizobium sp.]RWP03380.1 MAG: hypothetical protein EOQ99_21510 [Mesorhizobium sp.]TGR05645.1 hypothetical protein EN843_21110 [Mesorhizobium sp. M4B.F.Ca.ET.200.01.1.1]TGS16277.1 hypothetical protein EN833_21120 [Mesorhizobium sp. M4B.F.Ca.ET.190.01.1.1]
MADGSNMAGFEMAAYDCAILQFLGWDGTMAQFEAVLNRMLGGLLPNKVRRMTATSSVRLSD